MVRRGSTESEIDRSSFSYSSDEIYDADTASVTSSTSMGDNCDNELAIDDSFNKYNPSFGKISVSNSNDIHFGNKTFYQGPVTIKQFLYSSNGKLANSDSGDSVQKVPGLTDGVTIPNTSSEIDLNCADNDYNKCNETKSTNIKTEPDQSKKGAEWFQDIPRKHVIFTISLSIVLLVALVISTVIIIARDSITTPSGIIKYPDDGPEQDELDIGKSKGNDSFTVPGKLKIIQRTEWLAQPPTEPTPNLTLPVPYVIIMHSATEPCTDHANCVFHVRHIQMYHIESRKWWDIGYNFLVGGDGDVYEGRGWLRQGAHTYGYNTKSIGIAFIGTFNTVAPLPRQILAAKLLIHKGVELGYIQNDYKLFGARQLQSTESPGKLLFDEIKTWGHWAESP